MELQEGYDYLQLSGGKLGEKMVYVGVPNISLTRFIGEFSKRGIVVAQLKTEEVKNLNIQDVELLEMSEPVILKTPFKVPEIVAPEIYGEPMKTIYDGVCCNRCKKRYKHSVFCDEHQQDINCYRFKLEK